MPRSWAWRTAMRGQSPRSAKTAHYSSLGRAHARCPPGYARQDVELAYASTVYGAQGSTTQNAHLALSENTGAASAYVAMTRGRESNTVHLVAENLDDARQQWVLTFARNRADLGPAHAAKLATEEASKYQPYVAPRQQQPDVPSAAERARRHSSYVRRAQGQVRASDDKT